MPIPIGVHATETPHQEEMNTKLIGGVGRESNQTTSAVNSLCSPKTSAWIWKNWRLQYVKTSPSRWHRRRLHHVLTHLPHHGSTHLPETHRQRCLMVRCHLGRTQSRRMRIMAVKDLYRRPQKLRFPGVRKSRTDGWFYESADGICFEIDTETGSVRKHAMIPVQAIRKYLSRLDKPINKS